MKLNEVVPFGRSLDEYRHMFHLSDADLKNRILGVADGPASFNAELTDLKGSVVSLDPIYELTPQSIQQRFDQVLPEIIKQVEATPNDWVWKYHSSPDQLRQRRVEVTKRFVQDFSGAINTDRYVTGSLPSLPFADDEFDLALCSHFLFLYGEHFSLDFHVASILEMLRVAPEARIFPMIQLDLKQPVFLAELLQYFERENYRVTIEKVGYELQRGGNEMLRIKRGRVSDF